MADAATGVHISAERLAAANGVLHTEELIEQHQLDFARAGEAYSEWMTHAMLAVDTRFAPLKDRGGGKGSKGGGRGSKGGKGSKGGGEGEVMIALYPLDDPEDIDPGIVCPADGNGGGSFLAPRAFGGGALGRSESGVDGVSSGAGGGGGGGGGIVIGAGGLPPLVGAAESAASARSSAPVPGGGGRESTSVDP